MAVITTLVGDATEGAVNRPLLVIVPALALQETAVLLVDVKVATNCCVAPEETVVVEGDKLILTLEPFDEEDWRDVEDETPAQPVEIQARADRRRIIPNLGKLMEVALWKSGEDSKDI